MLIFGEKLVLNFLILFSKNFLNKMIKNVYFWIFLGKNLKSSRKFYNCKIVALIEDFDFFEDIFKTRHFRSFYLKKFWRKKIKIFCTNFSSKHFRKKKTIIFTILGARSVRHWYQWAQICWRIMLDHVMMKLLSAFLFIYFRKYFFSLEKYHLSLPTFHCPNK